MDNSESGSCRGGGMIHRGKVAGYGSRKIIEVSSSAGPTVCNQMKAKITSRKLILVSLK